jgi:hypothetical protein
VSAAAGAAAVALVLGVAAADAQQLPAATPQDSAPRVFLDCPNTFCDFDYFRTEITFVNWVRDRQYADVHLLVTSQETGGGGRLYTLTFIGLDRFAGAADTLTHTAGNTDTDDERRRALARVMRLGLVRFAARTTVAPQLDVRSTAPPGAAAQVRDPWNFWVFRLSANGNFNAEKSYRFTNLFGRASANRTTEQWKLQLSMSGNYNEDRFLDVVVYDSLGNPVDTTTVVSVSRSYGGNALVVRSLGPHWSIGGRVSAQQSTFANLDRALRVAPAIEYDIFPYTMSTRRLLTLQYEIGAATYDYRDTTIYNQTDETLLDGSLTVALDVKEPWGSAGVSLEGSHYFHDFTKNRLELEANAEIRVYKGLSLDLFGFAQLIRDQLFLPKGGATPTEVLLRRRELETSYRYFFFVGLSYTFGSKFSNVVNPRFDN